MDMAAACIEVVLIGLSDNYTACSHTVIETISYDLGIRPIVAPHKVLSLFQTKGTKSPQAQMAFMHSCLGPIEELTLA